MVFPSPNIPLRQTTPISLSQSSNASVVDKHLEASNMDEHMEAGSHLGKSLSTRLEPILPERSFSRPAPLPAVGALESSSAGLSALPSLNKVNLAEISAQNRPPRWVFNTSPTTGNITAKAPLVPPPQISQRNKRPKETGQYCRGPISKSKVKPAVDFRVDHHTSDQTYTLEAGESSRGPDPEPKTQHFIGFPIDVDGQRKCSDPFADPQSPLDLPDLFHSSKEDPFGDFYSVVSTSTSSENNSEDTQTRPDIDRDLQVHIVEADDDLFSSCVSLPEPDLKEDQAYFDYLEQHNHPDIARNQYQCRRGLLWDSAVNILMNHYIHPSDLTENEFVTLVTSQGNATSNWLDQNSRLIVSRRIRTMMNLHRELTDLGLPPRFLTDEYLEVYQCMQEDERTEFLNWFKNLKNDVDEWERDTIFSSAAKERYMGMTFVEKADYIGLDNLKLMKLKHTKSRQEDKVNLERIEKEIQDLMKLTESIYSTSTESLDNFGEPLERMNVHHTVPEETATHYPSDADVGQPLQNSQSKPSRKLSSFKSASELIKVVKSAGDVLHTVYEKLHHSRKITSSGPHEESSETTRFSYDSGIEVLSNDSRQLKTSQSLPEVPSHGITAKVRSGFFVNRNSHPPRVLKKTESHRDLKRGFRVSSFDSDAVQLDISENLSTAKEAFVAAPTLHRITPPSSVHIVSGSAHHPVHVSVGEVDFKEEPRYSSTATTAVDSSAGNHKDQKPKSIAESAYSKSSTSDSDGSDSVVRKAFAQAAEEHTREKATLRHKSSFWSFGRRKFLDLEADGDLLNANSGSEDKKPRTLRKTLSSYFSTARVPVHDLEQEVPQETAHPTGQCVNRRRLFRRRIPKWEAPAPSAPI